MGAQALLSGQWALWLGLAVAVSAALRLARWLGERSARADLSALEAALVEVAETDLVKNPKG